MVSGIGRLGTGFWAGSPVDFALTHVANVNEKLATLKQVNHGSDDPAGLMAAEQIQLELASRDMSQPWMEDAEVQAASALSAIQDTNMAEEASHLAREKILAKVAIAALKVGMHNEQTVLTLLQP